MEEKEHGMNAHGFLELMRKYTDVESLVLTMEVPHKFIDKVVVHHRQQIGKDTVQKIEIYYKMIGPAHIPHMKAAEREMYRQSFGRMKKTG